MFVLTFVEALKGLHREDIVRECNSLKNFALLCDEQVIANTLGQIRINFTCIFKVFPKMPSSRENFENKSEINS